jgi:hypothetical protein
MGHRFPGFALIRIGAVTYHNAGNRSQCRKCQLANRTSGSNFKLESAEPNLYYVRSD